jgi:ornithine carbamoyltransferase
MKQLAQFSSVPVINGLDNKEHPCQVITDLMTIKEYKHNLKGLNLVYFGDGRNNMAHSLLLGTAIADMNMKIVAPSAYWPYENFVKKAEELGGCPIIEEINDNSAEDADIIVTDTWVSMGDEDKKQDRFKSFNKYTVNKEIMKQARNDAIFMHCLPAYYGLEVTREVAYGTQSVIFNEAENRMWAQMAIIKWLLS